MLFYAFADYEKFLPDDEDYPVLESLIYTDGGHVDGPIFFCDTIADAEELMGVPKSNWKLSGYDRINNKNQFILIACVETEEGPVYNIQVYDVGIVYVYIYCYWI